MKAAPNQKLVKVKKAKCDKDHLYVIFNKHALFYAMDRLTFNELKIWCYLASNQDGYAMALSSKEISENCNIHIRRVQTTIISLIEKGYLVQLKDGSNRYIFHELPIQEEKCYEDKLQAQLEENQDIDNIW